MKKKSVAVFLLGFLLIGSIVAFAIESREIKVTSVSVPKRGHISFSTHRNALKFFDHETGKIYEYSEDEKLREIWVLEEFGKDLTKTLDRQRY